MLFVGSVNRNEVVIKFEKGMPDTTSNLNLYKELCTNHMSNDKKRMFIQIEKFKPQYIQVLDFSLFE